MKIEYGTARVGKQRVKTIRTENKGMKTRTRERERGTQVRAQTENRIKKRTGQESGR